jgi:hypothetical protein
MMDLEEKINEKQDEVKSIEEEIKRGISLIKNTENALQKLSERRLGLLGEIKALNEIKNEK